MGCGPNGCNNNGCSSVGCNRLNVFDWLNSLTLHNNAKPANFIEVSFNKGSRKDYYRNLTNLVFEKGEMIAVEGVSGFDIGMVSLTGELVKLQMKKNGVKDESQLRKVYRFATEDDLHLFNNSKSREQEVMIRSRAIAKQLKLEMKVCEVEIQADGKKATFFYTADGRVDFRELIKVYATEFKVKVEMKQIGARQESGKVGGIGSCGRELCCSTWLSDFRTVNTIAARYQNLSINQTKLSGQCGRLKCCLNFELDTYVDALRVFPDDCETLETAQGLAYLQKKDIFKNLLWYCYRDSSKQYPLTIDRVKEIKHLNKTGVKPEELQPIELEIKNTKLGNKIEMGFVNDVGQISLRSLEKGNKKRNKSSGNNKPQKQQPSIQTKQPQQNNNGKRQNQNNKRGKK
jgi:cell fate regulator YaaT (PSP1 superfamily)